MNGNRVLPAFSSQHMHGVYVCVLCYVLFLSMCVHVHVFICGCACVYWAIRSMYQMLSPLQCSSLLPSLLSKFQVTFLSSTMIYCTNVSVLSLSTFFSYPGRQRKAALAARKCIVCPLFSSALFPFCGAVQGLHPNSIAVPKTRNNLPAF